MIQSATNRLATLRLKLQPRLWQSLASQLLLIGIVAGLTLLPIAHIVSIISTTGADNLSNDYMRYAQLIDRILNGNYDWHNYLHDTFYNGHSLALPISVYLLVARFAHWNVYVEMYIGVALYALSLMLLHNAFTSSREKPRWLLWPILAALVFAVSQIGIFTFGCLSVQMGLEQAGIALGVWGLVRFPRRWLGIGLMGLGGTIATLSWGASVMIWPVCLMGLMLLNFRKAWHYAVWFSVGILASLPYPIFLFLQPSSGVKTKVVGFFNYRFILNVIGRPFTNGIATNFQPMPMAETAGAMGIALGIIGISLLAGQRSRSLWTRSTPALMLMAYSILSIWQVSIFRTGILPWYTTPAITFWIGLLGLAYALWTNHWNEYIGTTLTNRTRSLSAPMWSASVMSALVLLYGMSNLTYEDKPVHLLSRTPTSASCLRNYRTSPTYCESYLFQWGLGNPDYISILAQSLERHRLSVFAPRQQWTLQGDYVLNTVRIKERREIPEVYWSADLTARRVPWSDYKHLNLFLHTPNSVWWTVTLPANVKQADFHSAIAISQSAPRAPEADGTTFEVYIQPDQEDNRLVFSRHLAPDQRDWQPFSIPLSIYAGKTITLQLTSDGGKNIFHDWAMYRYPYINVVLDPSVPVSTSTSVEPSNTDLSPNIPKPTPNDFVFDVTNLSLWRATDLELVKGENSVGSMWTVGEKPALQFDRPLRACFSDYSHLYVRLAASPGLETRTLQVYYSVENQTTLYQPTSVITLLRDGDMHEYTYDLKLLELNQQARLTGLQLNLVYLALSSDENTIRITDLRLIRGDKPRSLCTGY